MRFRDFSWIYFVLRRFNAADTKGRSAITGLFSILGIAFGVMVLIVILSVMNGFQRSMIDVILQVSSAHVRLNGSAETLEQAYQKGGFKAFYLFSDSQTLIQGQFGKQVPALMRGIPTDILMLDEGFTQSIVLTEGHFDIEKPYTVVLGHELARSLSVQTGQKVSILAVAGSSEADLFPDNTELTVTGIIKTGYYAIDMSFSFVSNETAALLSGVPAVQTVAVKLQNPEADEIYMNSLRKDLPDIQMESWREYNHAFFGALRVEKNTMFMLVFLIFIVVTVNIYNGMRRSIYERREEISVLASLGAHKRHIQVLFIANGFTIGLIGSFIGLLLGLLLSSDINGVFFVTEALVNGSIELVNILIEPLDVDAFSIFSPQYFYIEAVPVRIFFGEVFIIFLFGILSASCAAWRAAGKILMLQPAEVLRYE